MVRMTAKLSFGTLSLSLREITGALGTAIAEAD
jgi:hypothetical protein